MLATYCYTIRTASWNAMYLLCRVEKLSVGPFDHLQFQHADNSAVSASIKTALVQHESWAFGEHRVCFKRQQKQWFFDTNTMQATISCKLKQPLPQNIPWFNPACMFFLFQIFFIVIHQCDTNSEWQLSSYCLSQSIQYIWLKIEP